jgi:hypothetical protein
MRSIRPFIPVVLVLATACPPPDDTADGGIITPPQTIDGGPAIFIPPDAGPDAGPQDRPTNTVTTIDAIEPAASGPMAGGNRVRIIGTGFTPTDLRVFFGDVEAALPLFQNTGSVSAEVPPTSTPGPVDVRVESTIGIGLLEGGYVYFSPVTIDDLDPRQGSTEGGTQVTLEGVGLTQEMVVLVGGRQVVDLNVVGGTSATFLTPPGLPGRANVEAIDAFGRSVVEFGFTYTSPLRIDEVVPNVVDDNNDVVEIKGAGFDDDVSGAPIDATIGGLAAPRVILISESRLRVRVPTGLVGAQDVVVTRGVESATLEDGIVIRPAPTGTFGLLAAVPSRADIEGGTSVTLVGDGLSTVTGITVGGAAATDVVVVDDRTVTFTAPPGTAGATSIVATRADTSTAQLDAFEYFAPVVIEAVVDASGPVAGGDDVTITGRGFTGATTVTFGGQQATNVVVVSDTEITATTPEGSAGPVDVAVSAGAERGILANGFLYEAELSIIGIRPARGGFNGNTLVTITGSGFTKAPVSVFFDDNPEDVCDEITVVSDSTLTCRTPEGSPGRVNVDVVQGAEQDTGEDLFVFFNPTTLFGGTRGGPIDGAVYLTALDATTGSGIPNLVAFVGTEGEPIAAGMTNDLGQATISSPDIIGPQTVTVAGDLYSTATFFDVNASELTVYLFYIGPPVAEGEGEGEPPATVRGRVFGFAKEFFDPAALDQSGCPPTGSAPEKCEIAFAEVNTTLTDEFGFRYPAGGDNVVFEEGGSYFIAAARPGRLALVALAGIFDINNQTIRFRQLGVRREVEVPNTGEMIDQDIELTIDLDAEIDMSLPDAPLRIDDSERGRKPSITRVIPFIQLAGEGAFVYTQAVEGVRNHQLREMPDVPPNMVTFIAGSYTTDGRNLVTDVGTVTVTEGESRVVGSGVNFEQDLDGNGVPDVLGAYFVMRNPADGKLLAASSRACPIRSRCSSRIARRSAHRAPTTSATRDHRAPRLCKMERRRRASAAASRSALSWACPSC